ncbi:preprotein translocase subunit YajC [Nocardioides montaniterrae]
MLVLLPLLVTLVLMWLFMIRPAQRRQAEALTMQRSVEIGEDVVLTSGVFGTVAEITDDHLGIEVAEGVVIRVLRGAIASKIHRDTEADDTADADADDSTYTTTDGESAVDGED